MRRRPSPGSGVTPVAAPSALRQDDPLQRFARRFPVELRQGAENRKLLRQARPETEPGETAPQPFQRRDGHIQGAPVCRRCAAGANPSLSLPVHPGDVWRPRHGSHSSQTGSLTSTTIDARDFRRARKDRKTRTHLPEGTLVAVTGGKQVADADAVWTTLDRTREKYGDMVIGHGGGPGYEKIAASWADARGLDQVVCRPDWNAHGKAAPFRRNDELLNLLPKGVIAFPGSGITGNLVDKAR